ncbi:MAG: hypothetical protein V5A42_00840 [Halofilum sp. (in: g-proteobacteria)]
MQRGRTNAGLSAAVLGTMLACTAPGVAAADLGIELHGGTLGAGAGLDIALADNVGARIGFNRFSTGEEWTEGDLDYDADLELESVHALLDWHPFGGVFRVTGGLLANDNRLEGGAEVDSGDQVGDGTAVNSGRLGAEVSFDDSAPYLGVGWSSRPANRGLSFSLDLGVMAQGSPEVELTEEEDIIGVNQDDLDREAREVEDDLSGYDTYPVLQLGVLYRF